MIRVNIGSVYDVVFFCWTNFNVKTVCSHLFQDENADVNEVLPEYCEVKRMVGEIPAYLQVFWIHDEKHRSVLGSLLDELDWCEDGFDTFIERISNAEWFKRFFISVHWPMLTKQAVAEVEKDTNLPWVFNLIDKIECRAKYSFYLKYVLDNWSTVIPELIIVLKKIYGAILERFEYNKEIVEGFYAQFDDPKVLQKVAEDCNYNVQALSKGYVSLSLLNPMMQCYHLNEPFIVFGLSITEKTMRKKINVTLEALKNIFGDTTRNEIIIRLINRRHYTCAEISDAISCSTSNAQYHLNILLDEGFIEVQYKKSGAFYYSIRAEYIEKVLEYFENVRIRVKD